MIIDLILEWVYYCFSWLISQLPSSSGLPAVFHTSAQYIGSFRDMLSPMISWSDMYYCVGAIVGVELGIWGFHFITWLLSHTRLLKRS